MLWFLNKIPKKNNIEFTVSSICSLFSDQKYVLKVGGKLNNVVILVTRFWSKMDLAPFGIKLFKYVILPLTFKKRVFAGATI